MIFSVVLVKMAIVLLVSFSPSVGIDCDARVTSGTGMALYIQSCIIMFGQYITLCYLPYQCYGILSNVHLLQTLGPILTSVLHALQMGL